MEKISQIIKLPDKNYRERIYPLPSNKRKIHKTYGLWICKTYFKDSYPPLHRIIPRAFKYYSLAHLISGDGWYWDKSSGAISRLKAGQGILMPPDEVHSYGGYEKNFTEDSICFTGPVADNFCNSGIIKKGIINIGKSRKLLPILKLAADPGRESQIKANISLEQLLTEIYFLNKENHLQDTPDPVKNLLEKINSNIHLDWNVSEMAEFCNLSVNQFRRIFYRKTGLKPKEYIDTLKINKAIEMLTSENKSITEVSRIFGYSDPYHFSRRFKNLTGLSPK